jgi:hypothetical protein
LLPLVLACAVVPRRATVAQNALPPVVQGTRAPAADYFLGEVEYKVTCTGSNTEGVALFKAFSPTSVKIVFGAQGFRLDETGGSDNHVVLNLAKREAYLLDAAAQTAAKLSYYGLDDVADEQLKAFMPYQFKTDLADTGRTATICGQSCREYTVVKSGFLRAGASAKVWLTDAFTFRPSRYNFETDARRVISPLPLSLPVPKGAILKLEVNEDNVVAVYEAVRLTRSAPPAQLFEPPPDYKLVAAGAEQ